MEDKHLGINKYASIINRLGKVYYDQVLAPYHLGSGQQFFLLHIANAEGISILELAGEGHYDKGTTARAVAKLEELQFIYRKADDYDKRIQRLYVSDAGKCLIPIIQQALHDWELILLKDIPQEEAMIVFATIQQMAGNASKCIQERKRDEYERNNK